MCGRYSLAVRREDVAAVLRVDERALPADLPPRYNIAPGQSAPVGIGTPGGRQIVHARWGIQTPWSSTRSAPAMINVRAESVLEMRPVGRWLVDRRCVVLASGFYEWGGRGRRRSPWYICHAEGRPLLFAGFWTRVTLSSELEFAIATTRANELVGHVHDRMPVILHEQMLADWLNPEHRLTGSLCGWAEPLPPRFLRMWPVSHRVNNVRNDDAACMDPLQSDPMGEMAPLPNFDDGRNES